MYCLSSVVVNNSIFTIDLTKVNVYKFFIDMSYDIKLKN